MITEGKAKLDVKTQKTVSKKMDVFYNPVMELNRTISIMILNNLNNKNLQIALPLAGSGVRGVRFLLELKKGIIKNISFNDMDKQAILKITKNLDINDISPSKVYISNDDANIFLLNSTGFDYIDIDPFGSPNFLLDSAVKRLSRRGILAVTATDTSNLAGTFAKACKRKYWATPLRNEIMHEIGIRILIRKIQLIGAQFDKALTPIYSYSKDHYYRVFFSCEKGKTKVDEILKQHGHFENAGPIWLGKLWDTKLAAKIAEFPMLKTIADESKINTVGFYHIPSLAKKYNLHSIPKQEKIISAIKKKGFKVAITHFKENSIRSNIPEKKLIQLLS